MTCVTHTINSYDITNLIDFILAIDGYVITLIIGLAIGYFIKKK